jgi:hypothetical protein
VHFNFIRDGDPVQTPGVKDLRDTGSMHAATLPPSQGGEAAEDGVQPGKCPHSAAADPPPTIKN